MKRRAPAEQARLTRLKNQLVTATTVEAKQAIIARILALSPATVKPRTTGPHRNSLSFSELIGFGGTDEEAIAAFMAGEADPQAAHRAAQKRVKTARKSAMARAAMKPRQTFEITDEDNSRVAKLYRAHIAANLDAAAVAGNSISMDTARRGAVKNISKKLGLSQTVVRIILKSLR